MNAMTRRLSEPGSWNASVIFVAVTLDGASPGRMTSGCFSAISPSDGNVSGSATAIAIQTAITAQGHRTTTSASRRISPSPHPGLRRRGIRSQPSLPPRYATRPQCPLSATRTDTDFIACMYRVTDFLATGLSGCMIAMTVPSPYRNM